MIASVVFAFTKPRCGTTLVATGRAVQTRGASRLFKFERPDKLTAGGFDFEIVHAGFEIECIQARQRELV
jgi:hypothetical protein